MVDSKNEQVSSAPLQQRGLNTHLAAQPRKGGTAHSQGCPKRSVPGVRDGTHWRQASGGPQKVLLCLKQMMQEERLKDLGLFSSEKRWQRMHLLAVFQNLNVGHRGVTWDTSNRKKASGGQLQEDKVWLNMGTMRDHRKSSSIGTGTHAGCESSSLDTLKIPLHKTLSYLI